MDIFSILFGLYFENIERGVKWCLSDGRVLRSALVYSVIVLFAYFTWTSHYKGVIERNERQQAVVMQEVKAILSRRKETQE